MRVVVIVMLLAIVASMGSAVYYLLSRKSQSSERLVRALTFRIGLSVCLFLLLMAGLYFHILPNQHL
ncbi:MULTISPECIES: twin transmembrane helix small protein [Leeia]|uniref:Twin transmembrane helix small protein n=1 Tax=Leeia aquatica TaxID=2725557 RepID=A0A847SCA0_9NEIS|nr:twin transmembrane helix small protein [Leeia aquatica]NLR74969.1 twin transmembrane helix small protein [Leeia aquatica]